MEHKHNYNNLEQFGMDEMESAIYLCLLELGPQLVQVLARNSGVSRSTLYRSLPEMVKKGFVEEISQGSRRLLTAVAPAHLYHRVESKFDLLKQEMHHLASLYQLQGRKPHVEQYDGYRGLQKMYLKILEQKKEIRSFLQVHNTDNRMMQWFEDEFLPRRIKKGIRVRALGPESSKGEPFVARNAEQLRETRLISAKKYPFRMEGMIQENVVYFASYEKGGPLVGLSIESAQLAETLAALFDLAWDNI